MSVSNFLGLRCARAGPECSDGSSIDILAKLWVRVTRTAPMRTRLKTVIMNTRQTAPRCAAAAITWASFASLRRMRCSHELFPSDHARLAPIYPADGRLHPSRAPFEFYPTPPEAVRALLSVEKFDGPVWEPACGNGAISRELAAAGHEVVSTDLQDYGFGRSGIDFLKNR
jgi:hypothetical protein